MGIGKWMSFMSSAARIDAENIQSETNNTGCEFFVKRSASEIKQREKAKRKRRADKKARRRNRT